MWSLTGVHAFKVVYVHALYASLSNPLQRRRPTCGTKNYTRMHKIFAWIRQFCIRFCSTFQYTLTSTFI